MVHFLCVLQKPSKVTAGNLVALERLLNDARAFGKRQDVIVGQVNLLGQDFLL
jgi:hypothetical protein